MDWREAESNKIKFQTFRTNFSPSLSLGALNKKIMAMQNKGSLSFAAQSLLLSLLVLDKERGRER